MQCRMSSGKQWIPVEPVSPVTQQPKLHRVLSFNMRRLMQAALMPTRNTSGHHLMSAGLLCKGHLNEHFQPSKLLSAVPL